MGWSNRMSAFGNKADIGWRRLRAICRLGEKRDSFDGLVSKSKLSMTGNAIYLVTIWAIPVIVAITFHEAAHGFVAHLLGDDTAWWLGRVSFNPAKHIDPFGTILLPGILLLLRAPFLFGYAKPVPVNFQKLRSPNAKAASTARMIFIAGPAAATSTMSRRLLFFATGLRLQ
jgi:Zn-dependent protease